MHNLSKIILRQFFCIVLIGILIHTASVTLSTIRHQKTWMSEEDYSLQGSLLWKFKTNGSIHGTAAIGDIDGDGLLEVVFGSNDGYVYALNGEDGSLLWSYRTNGPVWSSPSLGDIDGDGLLEVVFGSNDGYVYALNGEDGSLLWNFNASGIVTISPTIIDVDSDGLFEVIISSNDVNGYFYTFLPYGYRSWIYSLSGLNGSLIWSIAGRNGLYSATVSDFNGDGVFELLIGDSDVEVFLINGLNGSIIKRILPPHWGTPGFGFYPDYSFAVGDVTGDGVQDLVGFGWVIYAVDGNFILSNSRNSTIYFSDKFTGLGTPALGDVDGDGILDVVVNDVERLVAFSICKNETLFSVFLPHVENAITSPALADLTGDGKLDAIVSRIHSYYPKYSRESYIIVVDIFNKRVVWESRFNSTILASPVVGDVNGDGSLEVVFGDFDGFLYVYHFNSTGFRVFWQGFKGDFASRRNTLFIDGDGDSLSDYSESVIGSNPNDWDSDDDGVSDGIEVFRGSNSLSWDLFNFISSYPVFALLPVFIIAVLIVTILYSRKKHFSVYT